MKIKYHDAKIVQLAKNPTIFNKKFGSGIYAQYEKAILYLNAVANIGEMQKHWSLRLGKKKGTNNIGKFRINKSWRVEFYYDNKINFFEISEIEIFKIHNHKY